jgi:hypothetical protein
VGSCSILTMKTPTKHPFFEVLIDAPTDVWSESMQTDVLAEQFDFGEHTEADLDKVVGDAKPGQEFVFVCHYYEDDEASWTMHLRCVERSNGV